jgi:hypothetical protein
LGDNELSLPGKRKKRGLKLTGQFHLVPRLRIDRSIAYPFVVNCLIDTEMTSSVRKSLENKISSRGEEQQN